MSEYTRKINRGYQLTLPQTFRNTYHLEVGDYLRMYEEDGKLIIEPVSLVPKNASAALEALFDSNINNFNDLSEDEIMKLVRTELKKSRQEKISQGKTGKKIK